jgi:hypothetical protein
VAAHNNAAFEWIHHEPVARDAGLNTRQLSVIRNTSHSTALLGPDTLTGLQAAAVAFADSSTKDVAVPDSVCDNLQRQLRGWISTQTHDVADEVGIDEKVHTMLVEVAATVATYNMVSRFLVSLNVASMADDVVPWPADRQEVRLTLIHQSDQC